MTYLWWLHYGLPALISSGPIALVSLLGVWLGNRKNRRHMDQLTEAQTAQLLNASTDSETEDPHGIP